jgi:hypothetical protein
VSEQPRDWDRELADIDKAIARMPAQPAAPAPAPAPGARATPSARGDAPASAPVVGRRHRAATWLWVLLGAGLAGVLLLWPYPAACGAGLLGYLGADVALVLIAILGLRASWRARQGRANAFSLLLLLWGLVLGAQAVLPRIGYAKATADWRCPAGPSAV